MYAWTLTIISGATVALRTGTIRTMEREDVVFETRRKANYGLLRWPSIVECTPGASMRGRAFSRPLPDEMVDRGKPFGPKYVPIEQFAIQAKSIHPTAKHVQAIRERALLDAAGHIKSHAAV